MSIVQDALKKAENRGTNQGPGMKKRPGIMPVLLLILLIALLAFSVKKILTPQNSINSESAISVAESVIKPVTAFNYTPRNPSRSAGVKPQRTGTRNTQFPDLILSGIMHLVDGPRAIVNGVMVATGDIISGAKVIKIDKDKILLEQKGSKVVLGME